MNCDLNVIRELLCRDILGQIGEEYGRRFANLKERGTDAKLKMVKIFDVDEGSILVNMDRYDQPKSLFRNEKGQRKRCDYVLLTIFNNQHFMLFVEMKSSTAPKLEIQRQFKAAECVMDYCNAALNRFHDQNNLLDSFRKRFVVFYKPRSIAKRTTRPQCTTQLNDRPDRAFKYPSPHNPSIGCLVKP
jgi:hypothetical protein